MAYRKTDKVLADIEARKQSIIDAVIWIIGKDGIDALTTDRIAERAGVAAGLMYKYFGDKTELVAAALGQMLQEDINATKDAGSLRAAIEVFYCRLDKSRMKALYAPWFRKAVRKALESMIDPAGVMEPQHLQAHAGAVLGALEAFYEMKADAPVVSGFIHHLLPRRANRKLTV